MNHNEVITWMFRRATLEVGKKRALFQKESHIPTRQKKTPVVNGSTGVHGKHNGHTKDYRSHMAWPCGCLCEVLCEISVVAWCLLCISMRSSLEVKPWLDIDPNRKYAIRYSNIWVKRLRDTQYLEPARSEQNKGMVYSHENIWLVLKGLNARRWSGLILATSASPTTSAKQPTVSASSAVHGGQHDIKYLTIT